MILLLISFLAGVLTILAPCTLPLLPVIIGSSVGGTDANGKPLKQNLKKAFVIATSLGLSIIIFTLILKASTVLIDIPPTTWSIISGSIILIFGLISLFPTIWEKLPFISKLNLGSNKLLATGYKKKGFIGDVIIGAALGPVFSTCSPTYFVILATVLPQSILLGLVYLIAYVVGLGGVLLLVAFLGQKLVSRLGGLSDTHGRFKKGLGIVFIILGILIIAGIDKQIERKLLESGLVDVTKFEQQLLKLNEKESALSTAQKNGQLLMAPELVRPSGFINTTGPAGDQPITIAQYKNDKVVLLDIWTYSCINCQRTIPYLNAWYEKYKEYGFVIVGLHTPEFAFEQKIENVRDEVKKFGIQYPVVLDNDYATWNAYGNNFWPRKYLINTNGQIVYDHIGEGDYEKTEREIQKALVELNIAKGNRVVIPMDITKPSDMVGVNSRKVKSPEVYFGAARNKILENGEVGKTGKQNFVIPEKTADLKSNALYLGGIWTIGAEEAKNEGPAKISFAYEAKNVYMVASSKLPQGVAITIRRDGVVVKTIVVKEEQLYTLIEGDKYDGHLLEIEIPEAGLEAFTFTFG